MFKSVTLYTNKLKSLKRFYMNLLEWDLVEADNDRFTVKVGSSQLSFVESERPYFYHFAINIPGNQFSMMKYWLKDRVTLNREEGRDEVYFQSFDADSMYFEDPAGNIVELIGRRKRDLFGDLTKESFIDISEVGVATPYVTEVGELLQDNGIPLRNGTEVNPDELNFIGKDDKFVVLVPLHRRWYFSKKQSEVAPLEFTVNEKTFKIDVEGKIETIEEN